ncbi:hypothetical protein PENANT_c009G05163 [Penicillium antarcticum]|uniref:Uncharacterized protein n=1 Tax=Penicillium antarcticum TaxID=416450 RepID=A0A1V6Q8Z0_9EURO|nr:hypothetical protein PENANT_c009G05163 [Penicillium antarcticum]
MSPDLNYETLDAPDGSSLTWIFDHCLRYADQYEISLRAAYELNCHPTKSTMAGSNTPSVLSRNSVWSKASKSTHRSSDTPSFDGDANAQFRAFLTRTVSQLPSQPCSLPPSFTTSFVRRCFCLDLAEVDFAQALTALDYLKDLQDRWKKEIDAAFRRLNVTADDARDAKNSELASQYPGVMAWYQEINGKARMIDFLYTQVYVGLRRWILINEMMLEPYNKPNCLALLNTLLPPVHASTLTPTQQLAPKTLENHRDAFFTFIIKFEENPRILDPIMKQGTRPGDDNAWPAVYDTMDRYLTAVVEVIDECALINDRSEVTKSSSRRADSGISFVASRPLSRPTTSYSQETQDSEKPLPNFPAPPVLSKHGSILERFASSMSGWTKKDPKKEQKKERARSLKKMKSCKDISGLPDSSFSPQHISPNFNTKMLFDMTEEKRQRLIDEAKARKAIDAPAHIHPDAIAVAI